MNKEKLKSQFTRKKIVQASLGDPIVNHGNRQRASLIYFIKHLTYLLLDQIDQALVLLLDRFKRF